MKKSILVLTSVVSFFGCTTERIVERAPTPNSIQVNPLIPSDNYAETNFIEGLVATHPKEISNLGKVQTINLGRTMCNSIDKGTTINDLVEMATDYDLDAGFIGSVVRESVENFCPENQWFIDSALNG